MNTDALDSAPNTIDTVDSTDGYAATEAAPTTKARRTYDVAALARELNVRDPEAVARLVREIEAKRGGRSLEPVDMVAAQPKPRDDYRAPTRLQGEPKLSPQAVTILQKRYMKKDGEGKVIETVDGLFRRVANNLAQAEVFHNPAADQAAWAEEFYQVMANLQFIPNSPTVANAGRDLQQLSACFVLPVEDSLDKIFESVKNTALIHKTGGGTGFSFGRLRPKDDVVKSTGQTASGPVSFMKVFDAATEAIKQGGMRRGANMGILPVDHPDIEEFITCKSDMVTATNFNISVTVTEAFMRAVEAGTDYDLHNPRNPGVPAGKKNAREIFNLMVDNAWKNGDPGIVFIDRVNETHPCPHIAPVESTNPCGEQPLMPYESCNLGSINLSRFVLPGQWGDDPVGRVDWQRLGRVVKLATRFLDNVIDMNDYIVPEIEVITKGARKIGLGVMGWSDMLVQLGVSYDSEDGLRLGERVMAYIETKSNEASLELAQERGVFPVWKGSIFDKQGGPRYRNSTRTTIAPTGTISLMAGASSGVEPIFALCFQHHGLEGAIKERFVNPHFEAVARERGFYTDELMDEVAAHGSCQGLDGVPADVQRVFVTAHDITPEWHVRMQAAFQRHCDNAVSKTINFPSWATREDVEKAYLLAYREGCKGITIYRDSSRVGQVLTAGAGSEVKEVGEVSRTVSAPAVHLHEAVAARPPVLNSKTIKQQSPFGNLYVTVSEIALGEPFEVFATIGKAGSDVQAMTEATCRVISQLLRMGSSLSRSERLLLVIEQFEGIGGYATAGFGSERVRSIPDAIAKALRRYLGDVTELQVAMQTAGVMPTPSLAAAKPLPMVEGPRQLSAEYKQAVGAICPDCGQATVYMAEGCMTCQECGWSQC